VVMIATFLTLSGETWQWILIGIALWVGLQQ
jgi:hypothetical protein